MTDSVRPLKFAADDADINIFFKNSVHDTNRLRYKQNIPKINTIRLQMYGSWKFYTKS